MIKSIAKLTLSLGVLGLFATVATAQGRDGSGAAGPEPAPTRSTPANSGPGSAHYAWADVLRVDPIYDTVSVTRSRRECHDERVVERHQGNGTAGAVLGAVVGGVLGNTVGKGDGRKAATVGGAVAGGAIGHEIGQGEAGEQRVWRIEVRLDDGRYATVTQDDPPDVRVGDYVEVRNNHVYRR